MIEDADISEALVCLAQLTMYAPSPQATVKPFWDAHGRACRVLDRLQGRGFEEATKGDWIDLLGVHGFLYVIAWSGGYDAPSYAVTVDEDSAWRTAETWAKDMREGEDTIDVLRVNLGNWTVESLEAPE